MLSHSLSCAAPALHHFGISIDQPVLAVSSSRPTATCYIATTIEEKDALKRFNASHRANILHHHHHTGNGVPVDKSCVSITMHDMMMKLSIRPFPQKALYFQQYFKVQQQMGKPKSPVTSSERATATATQTASADNIPADMNPLITAAAAAAAIQKDKSTESIPAAADLSFGQASVPTRRRPARQCHSASDPSQRRPARQRHPAPDPSHGRPARQRQQQASVSLQRCTSRPCSQPPDRSEEDQSRYIGLHFELDEHPLLTHALISTPSIRQEVESHSTANKNQYLESVTKRGYSLLRKDKHQSFLISMIPSGRVNPSEGAAPASNSIATPASDSITLQDTLYVQIRGGPLPMHPSEGVADNLERHRISNGKRLLHCLRSNQLGVQSACTGPQRLDNSTSLTNQSGHSSNIQCPITQLSVPFPSTGVAPAATVRADSFDGNTRVPTPSIEHDDSTLNDIRPDQLEVIAIAKAQATVSHVLGPYTGISYAMHPCTRFSAAPEMEYDKALKWLDRYLIETRNKHLMFDPKEQSFDASFGDEWDRAGALVDADTASSRTGFVISYTNCPVIWTTRLSTQIALSSAEAGHIALITALRGMSVHDIDTSSQCNDVFASRSMTQCSSGIAFPSWVCNDSARGSMTKQRSCQ
jgi:hypothetical protein